MLLLPLDRLLDYQVGLVPMTAYCDSVLVDGILAKYADSPPSFTVNLYPEHWSLNNSQSKFLYNNPVAVRPGACSP